MFRIIFVFFFCSFAVNVSFGQRLLIAAASDLKFALDSVVTVFQQKYPTITVDVVYGSSGKLYEQIAHGAPFDLYFSADVDYPRNLSSKGLIAGDVTVYGTGRLVFWSRHLPNLENIHSAALPAIKKIAIANPQHAPYGKRAVETLRYYKLYESVKGKLVYGENISQAAQFAATGAADAGIIALSLVNSPTMQAMNGRYWLIPEAAHSKLEQGFVILKSSRQKAVAFKFRDYMALGEVQNILAHYGFNGDIK